MSIRLQDSLAISRGKVIYISVAVLVSQILLSLQFRCLKKLKPTGGTSKLIFTNFTNTLVRTRIRPNTISKFCLHNLFSWASCGPTKLRVTRGPQSSSSFTLFLHRTPRIPKEMPAEEARKHADLMFETTNCCATNEN